MWVLTRGKDHRWGRNVGNLTRKRQGHTPGCSLLGKLLMFLLGTEIREEKRPRRGGGDEGMRANRREEKEEPQLRGASVGDDRIPGPSHMQHISPEPPPGPSVPSLQHSHPTEDPRLKK